MGFMDMFVKLPVDKHSVARRTAEILWLHVLFLEVPSHVINALDIFSTQETHEAVH